jgi:hypothetical protein
MSQFQDANSAYTDPTIIQIQGTAGQAQTQSEVPAVTGAITSLNGLLASVQTLQAGAGALTVVIASAGQTHTFSIAGTLGVANGGTGATTAAGARGNLGLGGLAVLNPGVAVPNSAVVAAAGYVQADFQSVIDTLNAALTSLRNAGIIAT